jgi:hypothetical protein
VKFGIPHQRQEAIQRLAEGACRPLLRREPGHHHVGGPQLFHAKRGRRVKTKSASHSLDRTAWVLVRAAASYARNESKLSTFRLGSPRSCKKNADRQG